MEIISRSNPKIKYIRSLHQKKHREQQKRFLIEGKKPIQEALKAGVQLEFICINQNHTLPTQPIHTHQFQLSSELMGYATTLSSAPDMLAVAHYFTLPSPLKNGLHILSEGLQDPGNFGALIRLAYAMGAQKIWTSGAHVDPYHPKVQRGAMGANFFIPIASLEPDTLFKLKEEGWTFVSTVLSPDSQSSYDYSFSEKTCLLLGNEGQGLSDNLQAQCDVQIMIPLHHNFESLNVTTTAAMLLHEYNRQRRIS